MTDLFIRIFVFVVAAFALGVAVGFLLWRWRRHNLPSREWTSIRRELGKSQAAAGRAMERVRMLERLVDQLRGDLTRANLRGVEAERQRAIDRATADEHDAASAKVRTELVQLEGQVVYLRRRLTDLSILAGTMGGADAVLLTRGRAPDSLPRADGGLTVEESVASSR